MNKYIIYTQFSEKYLLFFINYLKQLEKLGWKLIKFNTKEVQEILLNENIVLIHTFYEINYSEFIINKNCKIIYKIEDYYEHNKVGSKNIINFFKEKSSIIISPYAYNLDVKTKLWVPHSVNDENIKNINFNNNPINKILLSGYLWKEIYPFRNFVFEMNDSRIDMLNHPGYKENTSGHDNDIVGVKYINFLNKYICCFVDASIEKYIFLKNYEITASGSLLLGDDSIEEYLKKLGFIDNISCILCNKENIKEKIDYILDPNNRNSIDVIRKKGMLISRKHHLSSIRAIQFNDKIDSIFKKVKSNNKDEIPRIIHQIWIGPKEIPKKSLEYIKKIIELHPNFQYRLWTNEDLIEENFSNLEYINKCKSWTEKSDIMRYDILYKYGGIYLDIDFEIFKNLEPLLTNDLVVCNEDNGINHYMSGGFIACKQYNKNLLNCVNNIKYTDLTLSPSVSTGPYYFRKNIILDNNVEILATHTMYPTHWTNKQYYPYKYLDGTYGVHHWDGDWSGDGITQPQ